VLLFVFFLGWLVVSPAVHYLMRQHPLASFRWLSPVFRDWAKDKRLIQVLVGAIVLHLIGTRWLGQVAYNTSGFDVMTHTLFGFLARELIDRTNRVHPLTAQIGDHLLKPTGRIVTTSTLALAFCFAHEAQEQIQTIIPGLSTIVYIVTWQDQVKDLLMDTIGIIISLKKNEGKLVMAATSLVFVIGLGVFFISRV